MNRLMIEYAAPHGVEEVDRIAVGRPLSRRTWRRDLEDQKITAQLRQEHRAKLMPRPLTNEERAERVGKTRSGEQVRAAMQPR